LDKAKVVHLMGLLYAARVPSKAGGKYISNSGLNWSIYEPIP
jgi:hypothetical protein